MGGGESKTEIRYEYKDNTVAVESREYQREKERLEREKRQQEERESRQQMDADMKAQELDRKANPIREQVTKYQFGLFTSLASFRGLDVKDIKQVRIGVVGPTGSGKTCFIGTVERVMRNENFCSAVAKATGSEGTVILKEYLQEMPFCLVDTRGLFSYGRGELKEVEEILFGRIKPGQVIDTRNKEIQNSERSKNVKDFIHAVIIVVKANDERLLNESFKSYYAPIRAILRPIGMNPITVVTHSDELKTDDERMNARQVASATTGSSMDHTFLVSNYTPENGQRDPKIELEILKLFQFTLMVAEKYIKIAKQQIKLREENEPMPQDSIESVTTDVFMRALGKKHKWSEDIVREVLSIFEIDDIMSVGALAMNWSLVKERISRRLVRLEIEKELKSLDLEMD